jgi:hypothetical protein
VSLKVTIYDRILSASKLDASAKPDDLVRAEDERDRFEQAKNEETIKDSKLNRDQRDMFGKSLLHIVQFWLAGIFFLTLWQGWGFKLGFFHLSDTVMVTLLVTTTANVLGLLYVVVRSLFGNGKAGPDTKKEAPET